MEIEELANVIRNMQPRVPLNRAWWSPADVAEYLRVSPYTVSERYSKLPSFPEAKRLPSPNGRGHLRWKASEVMDWWEKQ